MTEKILARQRKAQTLTSFIAKLRSRRHPQTPERGPAPAGPESLVDPYAELLTFTSRSLGQKNNTKYLGLIQAIACLSSISERDTVSITAAR